MWSVLVSLAVALAPPVPPPVSDPEVAKGIQLVQEGDYDAGIVLLDAATRRLAGHTPLLPDLGQAYLHLGIAYFAKGHETVARARFREALAQAKDLELSPDRFAPKLIEVFQKAKEESQQARPAAKRGGSGKGLLVGGVLLAAAGGGLALAAGGGGSAPGPSTAPVSSAPLTDVFPGLLGSRGGESAQVPVGPFGAGPCSADLSWSSGATEVRMFVNDAGSGTSVAETRRLAATSSRADWTCRAGTRYRIDLFLQEPRTDVSYELRMTHPSVP